MSSRVFQSIVLQMKECTDRVIGVIDDQGTVVSCNQLTWIGEKWEGAASALNTNDGAVVIYGDKTFKPLASRSSHYDYAAFVQGSDEQARLICSMVTVALNSAKAYYEEKHDKTAFVKSIISDNILLGDIYVRAKELPLCLRGSAGGFPGAPGGVGGHCGGGCGAEPLLREPR